MGRRRDGSRGGKIDVIGQSTLRRSSSLRLVLVGALAVGLMYVGVTEVWRRAALARLPVLPSFEGQPAAVIAHLKDTDKAARAAPHSATAVGALCLAYHADVFLDQAERCYARAEELDPDDWRWAYYRALAQGERGNGGALVETMRRVIAAAPDFGPAWLRLGEAEFKRSRYEAAADAWRRAASLAEPPRILQTGIPEHVVGPPLSAYATLGLARVALTRGDAQSARQILEGLTVAAPRFGPAFRLLGDAYARLDRPADAERAVRRANGLTVYAPYADPLVDALAVESRNSTFLLQQAVETDLNSFWDEYLTRRALEFDPDNPDVVYKLGGILRILGRNDEALDLFQRYQRLMPDDFQALGQIGSCLGDLGRFEEAEAFLRRALQHVDDALTHYNLGFVLTRVGRLNEAVAAYERALERDPNHIEARINLAAILARQGKLDRATRELTRVLETDPENPGAHTNLGLVLAQHGLEDRAAREFQEALRINPQQTEARDALRAMGR